MDKSLMEGLKELREKKVPPVYLKGFSESIERKILDQEGKKSFVFEWPRFTVSVWVPALAVLVLAVTLVTHHPLGMRSLTEELSEEIDVIAELGEWSEEDESSLESFDESDLEALEVSYAGNAGRNRLA